MNLLRLITARKSGIAYDPDAQAFFTAAGITDATQKSAVNTLVTDLKGYGIWSKMLAVYPLVGGTATTCKYNLKDPRDLDAAYRLTFTGGANLVISNTGIQSLTIETGVYADTKFNPTTAGRVANDVHLSYYSRTTNTNNSYDMAGDDNGCTFSLMQYGTTAFFSVLCVSPTSLAISSGLHTGSSTNTQIARYRNAVKLASIPAATAIVIPSNRPVYLLANSRQIHGETSTREFAFASIGLGLSDADVANLYTAVQAFQTTLGRQV